MRKPRDHYVNYPILVESNTAYIWWFWRVSLILSYCLGWCYISRSLFNPSKLYFTLFVQAMFHPFYHGKSHRFSPFGRTWLFFFQASNKQIQELLLHFSRQYFRENFNIPHKCKHMMIMISAPKNLLSCSSVRGFQHICDFKTRRCRGFSWAQRSTKILCVRFRWRLKVTHYFQWHNFWGTILPGEYGVFCKVEMSMGWLFPITERAYIILLEKFWRFVTVDGSEIRRSPPGM